MYLSFGARTEYDTMKLPPMRAALIVLFAIVLHAPAQTPLGTVSGLAVDISGGAVPNAPVTLVNEQTGVKRATTTNSAGAYSFPNLSPGTYKLSAEAKGFRPLETRPFPVEAFRSVRQDLKLEVAAASTEVVVTATAAAAIQVETPAVGSALQAKQIIELPTNLRSISKNSGDSGLISAIMPLTVPGVVQVGAGAKWLTPGAGASSTKVKVDGIETTFGNFGGPDNVSQPSVEAVEEFTATVLTARAEFGGMGTITSVTKSGTNGFHGGVFWYLRNSATDAKNYFATSKPFQNLHNYGGSVGGPLRRDRTFFFADFDGMRGVAAYFFSPSVPTLGMRQGDFTGIATLRNPFTNGTSPLSGNTVLPQYFSPQALKAQQLLFPLPNYGAANLTSANYRAWFNGPETHRTEEFKLDHNFRAGHSAFLRYSNRKDDYHIPGARSPLPPTTVGTSDNIRRVNFWTLGDVYTIRPNLLNEFRAGVVILVSQSSGDLNGQAVMNQLGIQGLPDRGSTWSLPYLSISGVTGNSINLLNPVNDGHAQVADNLSWIRGRHTMKFGIEELSWFDNRFQPNTSGNPILGQYSFTGKFTGNAYADFLLGFPATVTRMEPYRPQYIRARDWAAFAQDDFKATRRLTLMYGLRYEYNGPAYALDDNIFSFDLATARIVIPSENAKRFITPLFPSTFPLETAAEFGTGRSLRNPDRNNFAPRFGFAYQLTGTGRTVLRGGWGVYYSHYSGNIPVTMSAGPFSAVTVSTNNVVNGAPQYSLANPFAIVGSPGTLALAGVAPHLLNSYTQQYTLSLEHAMTRNLGLRLSYMGSKGTQLPYRRDANQPTASTLTFSSTRRPFPQYANITYSDNGANMLYSAMQAQVHKRFSRGLMFMSTWTWAKEISDTDDTGDFELNTTIENSYDRRRDRGNVYSVPRHQWMNQALYELPGKGNLLGGWQFNLLLNVSGGNWYTPVISGPDPTGTNQTVLRPDIHAASIPMPKRLSPWFDPTVFTTPASGKWGNAGRGIIEGPGYLLFNLGLQKTVRFERVGALQVVASFQNILNHPNFGEPTAGGSGLFQGQTTVNNANGGKITSTHIFPPAGGARTGQLGLRWDF
jgi:hypothetical protein